MPRESAASDTSNPGAVPVFAASSSLPAPEFELSQAAPSNEQQYDPDVSILSTASTGARGPGKQGAKLKEKASDAKDNDVKDGKEKEKENLGIDDLLLPRTLMSRMARGVLPPNTSISKDALLALTKASTVFISHLASKADELTTRRTIAPQDVLNALDDIEWGSLKPRCEGELKIYEDVMRDKRKGYRDRVKARESGASVLTDGQTPSQVETTMRGVEPADDEDEDAEPAGKRPRVGPSEDTEIVTPSLPRKGLGFLNGIFGSGNKSKTVNGQASHRNRDGTQDDEDRGPGDSTEEEELPEDAADSWSSEEEEGAQEDEEEDEDEDGDDEGAAGPASQLLQDAALSGDGGNYRGRHAGDDDESDDISD